MTEERADLPPPEPVHNERDIARELRLRPEPPHVVRLSRKALGLMASVAAIAVGGALIFALQPARETEQQDELYTTENRTTPDPVSD